MGVNSCLGMAETEACAERIIKRCREAGTWLIGHHYTDMEDDYEQVGYLHLIAARWIKPAYCKRPFYVTQDLLTRFKNYDVHVGTLGYVSPTTEDILFEQTGIRLPPKEEPDASNT